MPPVQGILPIINKDGKLTTKKDWDENWLPGTQSMTTMISTGGPFQFVPRKRRNVVLSRTAAGVVGGDVKMEQYRYYNDSLKSRRLLPNVVSIPPIL